MPATDVDVHGSKFLINGLETYTEIESSRPQARGLLMNARFIQGIFDDRAAPQRFAIFGHDSWDPEANTDRLIAALPEWHRYGLRAFTVGLQGGGPVLTVDDWASIDNNPFGPTGSEFDDAYAARLDRLVRAADELGMIVIVSLLYASQGPRLRDGRAVRNAVITGSNLLRDAGYTNVIIEVANEHNLDGYANHPIVHSDQGVSWLIDLARAESGGMLVGSSGVGGYTSREVADASDVILIHANGLTRQGFYNMIRRVQSWQLERPIVCNEDSPCYSRLGVAFHTGTSWGYYNNHTKQDVPADWSVTAGEDTFFAHRMAEGIGIPVDPLPIEEHYYFQGFEPHMVQAGKRWIRLAALHPEAVDYVEYYRNGALLDIAYDEPFYPGYETTWIQRPVHIEPTDETFTARIFQTDGSVIERRVDLDADRESQD